MPVSPHRNRRCTRGAKGLAALLVLVPLTAFNDCQGPQETPMPRELVGVWKASAAPYADRFLELTQHTITFGTGKESVAVHPIIRLEAVRKDQLIVYTVSYLEEDVESRLSFSYEATQQGGMIRLRHREQIVWEKERTRSHETHLDPATPLR